MELRRREPAKDLHRGRFRAHRRRSETPQQPEYGPIVPRATFRGLYSEGRDALFRQDVTRKIEVRGLAAASD